MLTQVASKASNKEIYLTRDDVTGSGVLGGISTIKPGSQSYTHRQGVKNTETKVWVSGELNIYMYHLLETVETLTNIQSHLNVNAVSQDKLACCLKGP